MTAQIIADMMEAQARQLLAAAALMRVGPAAPAPAEPPPEDEATDAELRRADILDAVKAKPGIQRRGLARDLRLKDGTVAGDCARLAKEGLIVGDRRTGYLITDAGREELRRIDGGDPDDSS